MLDDLRAATPTCDAPGCDRALPGEPDLAFRTDAGERRAYECGCGALTVTVARRDPAGAESTR